MSLMKKTISLAVLGTVACLMFAAPAQAKKKASRELTVAIFPFESLNKKHPRAGEGCSDAIINHFVREKSLKVVEEAQLAKAIDSLARNQMGLFREDSALQIGDMVDARFIVIGSVDFLGGQIAINARVLEVETRELLVAERTHGPETSAFKLYDDVGTKLTKALNKHLARRVTRAGGASADSIAVNDLIGKGKRAMKKGSAGLPEAVKWFSKAVVRDPNNVRARVALGHAFIETGNYQDARVNLAKAVEMDDSSAPAHTFLGYAEDKLGNPDEGRAHYETAIDLDPKFAIARFYMAANLANNGAPEEAKPHAKMAAKLGYKKAKGLLRHIDKVIAYEKSQAAER
jgi:TolB-like protein